MRFNVLMIIDIALNVNVTFDNHVPHPVDMSDILN